MDRNEHDYQANSYVNSPEVVMRSGDDYKTLDRWLADRGIDPSMQFLEMNTFN